MNYVLKLGPVELGSQSTNVYLRADERGNVAPPVFSAVDVDGIKSLLADEPVACAPELAEAARALELAVAPVPQAVLRSAAAIAVFMTWGQRGIAELGSELALASVEAATEFWNHKPWSYWRENQPLAIEVTGTLQREFEAALLGNAFQGFGLVLYPNAGDVKKLAELQTAGDFDAAKRLSGVALMLDDKPAYAVGALEQAGQLPRVPVLLRSGKAGPSLPTGAEALTLVGAVRAVAQLSPSKREAAVDCRLKEDEVRVIVRAPAPVLLQ